MFINVLLFFPERGWRTAGESKRKNEAEKEKEEEKKEEKKCEQKEKKGGKIKMAE